MGKETASFISQLDASWPLVGDPVNQGDDHLRLLKEVLQTQFPNLTAAAANMTVTELNLLVGLAASTADLDKTQVAAWEGGATADQTDAEIRAAVDAATDSNVFTDSDLVAVLASKVITDFITITQAVNLDTVESNAAASKVITDFIAVTQLVNLDTMETKLATVETNADVTDTANVMSAGALMDSEVDADIKTLSLPASTTISGFGATLVDDGNEGAARVTLGVDAAGTVNYTHPNHSGQVTSTADGAQVLANSAITGQTLQSAAIVGTDELLMSDGGTIKRSIFTRIYTYIAIQMVAAVHTWASKQTFNGELALNAGYSEDADTYTVSTGTKILDTALATYFYPTGNLGTATITFQFNSPASSGRVTSFTLEMLGANDATLVWPGTIDWANGNEPVWTSGRDIVTFVTRDGGTTWYGFLGGLAFA